MKNLILNLTGETQKKITLNLEQSITLRSSNLKINNFIKPEDYGLSLDYTYKISGGSTESGTPCRRYIISYNALKQKVLGRKKAVRVFGNMLNSNWSVVDLLVKKIN